MKDAIYNKEDLLENWMGNRRLTRRVIEKFPEDQLFTFSIGSMRTFAQLCAELLAIAVPTVYAIHGKEVQFNEGLTFKTKEELLQQWDEANKEIVKWFIEIPVERFQERLKLFDQYDGIIKEHITYIIENEIHHRAQAYVYLRALGIEPPFFWER